MAGSVFYHLGLDDGAWAECGCYQCGESLYKEGGGKGPVDRAGERGVDGDGARGWGRRE